MFFSLRYLQSWLMFALGLLGAVVQVAAYVIVVRLSRCFSWVLRLWLT